MHFLRTNKRGKKKLKTKVVIHKDCFSKVPFHERINYESTEEEPTHKYVEAENEDGFNLADIATGVILTELFDSSPSIDTSAPDTVSNFDFGGGDSGGAGASGDW